MLDKLTRPTLLALSLGVAYLLLMTQLFPRRELATADYATAALLGSLLAAAIEALIRRFGSRPDAPPPADTPPPAQPPSAP
jgi:hypothetical protein